MITSTSNIQLKRVQALNEKAKVRRTERCFVVEGRKLFEETPESLRSRVFVSETFCREHEKNLLKDVVYDVVADRAFRAVCDTKTPQGIITIAKMPEYDLDELLSRKQGKGLFLLLEDLQDPGNLGTIIRTAEGAGVDGIIASSHTADVFQPKVTRATMGSVFRVPFIRVDDILEAADTFRTHGIQLAAAHLHGSVDYNQADYRTGTAFMIGNEGNGLTEALAAKADVRIRIPMEGSVESLNAAIASALLMYEAYNQRRNG